MAARVAFIVNSLTGAELQAGKADAARVYRAMINPELGACDSKLSPAPLFECPSREKFHTELAKVLNLITPEDQLVLYFSGHGTFKNRLFCLVFPDANYPFQNLLNEITANDVSRALLILDACHSGAAIDAGLKSFSEDIISDERLPQGIAIFASCRSAQVSAELRDGSSSVFTELLCLAVETGLGGKPSKDGRIGLEDALSYIGERLANNKRYAPYAQTPQFGVRGADGQIWIALNKNGSVAKPAAQSDGSIVSDEELRIASDSTAASRRPCADATIADLNEVLVREFAEKISLSYSMSVNLAGLAKELRLFSPLSRRKSILHSAAVLCFSPHPERFIPQARSVYVSGDVSSDRFVNREIVGPLSSQIEQLVELVTSELHTVTTIGGSGRREDTLEIPAQVMREAIANAVAHRDYSSSGTVTVCVTREFVEISNPGSFPEDWPWSKFIEGDDGSVPTDPTIAYYLNHQLAFEGVGRGFAVFRDFLSGGDRDALVFADGPGPSVKLRFQRRCDSQRSDAHSGDGEPSDPEKHLKAIEGRCGYIELAGVADAQESLPSLRIDDAFISMLAVRPSFAPLTTAKVGDRVQRELEPSEPRWCCAIRHRRT